jgi:hypothetical protein
MYALLRVRAARLERLEERRAGLRVEVRPRDDRDRRRPREGPQRHAEHRARQVDEPEREHGHHPQQHQGHGARTFVVTQQGADAPEAARTQHARRQKVPGNRVGQHVCGVGFCIYY